MKNTIHCFASFAFVLTFHCASSQENTFTAGFQYKPIFASEFFSTGIKSVLQNGIGFSIAQQKGHSLGMILRRGINKQFSLEGGINLTKRNFSLAITDTTFTGTSHFTSIGYEIPIQVLIFLRLSEKIYMNTSLGMSMDMYASGIATDDTAYFRHYSERHSVFQFAALANLGFEYRTKKIGYFYFGSSYHLPFSYSFTSNILYLPTQDIVRIRLGGNYLTVDFRYYFHEDPLRPKKKKKKEKK